MEDNPAGGDEARPDVPVSAPPPRSNPSSPPRPTTPSPVEPVSLEDSAAEGDETLPAVPLSAPLTSIPPSAPTFPTTTRPIFTSETAPENKAMTSDECSSALPSPAEASPAKPAGTLSTSVAAAETSQATSRIASASDALSCTETSPADDAESLPASNVSPASAFGCQDPERDFPGVLTFKGVSVTLENNSVWKKFCSCGTEMILTKHGRRMFPYCRYRLSGLDPKRLYSLVLSIVPSNQYKYRRSGNRWEISGPAEYHTQGLIRAFSHHHSPNTGSFWMCNLVSFYKLKLTNNSQDQEGHIILHSMQRYIPRLHVIPAPDGGPATTDQPVVMGPESMTFTFPQTEFIGVTTYQNFQITQLKIDHNPFARGFREDSSNSRLQRLTKDPQGDKVQTDGLPDDEDRSVEEIKDEPEDLSIKTFNTAAPLSAIQRIRLVLKPIMSNPTNKAECFTPCIRGNYALGELVLVEPTSPVEPKEEESSVSVTAEEQRRARELTSPKSRPTTPVSSSSTPSSSPGYRKKRRRVNRRWANSRGRDWKPAAASSAAVQSLSTVSTQPVMDDVEGLLFASFTSKEALQDHVGDKPAANAAPAPVSPPANKTMEPEPEPETDGETITRLEPVLLSDLCALRHRQVIHPVLQEVGMKLSSLDPSKPIDLRYLGVCLPLPPPNLPERTPLSPGDEGSSFISRTGKTSDMTKIKGWKTKFMRNKESSPSNCEGLQKNLSAFCSNMLDEYLESEAKQITERAAAFSASPEGSVAYQLPAKSSSYVKTLDSALKHRDAASKVPGGTNRPCPLSHKPLLYSALTAPPPPLGGAQLSYSSSPSHGNPAAAASFSPTSDNDFQSSSAQDAGVDQTPAASAGQSQGATRKPLGLNKSHLKLIQMETGAQNQGLSRTTLTADRLSVALSVMLTKEMQPHQIMRGALFPNTNDTASTCGEAHCRLGCVCPSLQPLDNPPHCKKPECMFSCACKLTDQTTEETQQQIRPTESLTNVEQAVQPRPGSHPNKLWSHNDHGEDPEPLFTPRSTPLCGADDSSDPTNVPKRTPAPPRVQPIREEDKDPVYKYFESLMTCARVREINSKPPPQVALEQNIFAASVEKSRTTSLQTTADSQTRDDLHVVSTVIKQEKPSQKTTYNEKGAKEQIQIQSLCPWQNDRRMILEELCLRMKQSQLCKQFTIGPYCINPVSKICMRKPSGSTITYRVQISKRSTDSDYEEDESEEEKEPEEGEIDGPEMLFGVTPFLRGVLPAGRLKARRKAVGVQEQGLVQVNGKAYNHARLMLGSIGSLHPANRLAAYITGRLRIPNISALKTASTGSPNVSAAGSVKPAVIPAREPSDVKTSPQPHVPIVPPDHQREGSTSCVRFSPSSLPVNPVQPLISSQSHLAGALASSSPCSPVSLTVSPSLKRPSFLEESGTCSFRICPPSNQGAEGQKLPGVSLPGGFTLIQLPKPAADGAARQQGPTNNASQDDGRAEPLRKNGLLRFSKLAAEWLGSNSSDKAPNLSNGKPVEAQLSEMIRAGTQPSDKSGEAHRGKAESELDSDSDDFSSDSSDYDDDSVDIETVEESQGAAIAQMRAEALTKLKASGGDEVATPELQDHKPVSGCKDKRRQNHTALERVRRSEQRLLFNKLQEVLQCDPKTARLAVLLQAFKEIQDLVQTSTILEMKKRVLVEKQAVYIEKLSLLSGKTDVQIKNKLTEICHKQKSRESTCTPFSQLLQTRAAQLQTAASLSSPAPTTQEGRAPSQGDLPLIPVHKNIRQMISMLKPHLQKAFAEPKRTPAPPPPPPPPVSQPQPRFLPTRAEASLPSPQVGIEPGEVVETLQLSLPALKLKNTQEAAGDSEGMKTAHAHTGQLASLEVATRQAFNVQNARLSAWLKKKKEQPHGASPQLLTLPLIRSKAGRIILPSCLKPVGQGLYTLTVMKSTNGEAGQVSAAVQPSAAETSKEEAKNQSESEDSEQSESSCESDDDDAPPESNPKPTGVPNALAKIVALNQSLAFPPKAPNAVRKSQEVLSNSDMNKIIAAARLTFKQVCHGPVSGEAGSNGSPAIKCPRGQPPVSPAAPARVNEMHSRDVVNGSAGGNAKIIIKEPARIVPKADDAVPAKRGRGRPPKRKSPEPLRPAVPVKRVASLPSKPKKDDPTVYPCNYKSPLMRADTTRPMTRGALGKDFPSAKKRSWIDLEKELDGDDE